MANWLSNAKEAYESSTSFIDENLRSDWEYSVKAFKNEHAPGSKYLSEEYKARSRIFRPKTRSIIRKNEAAAAVALFSNMDIVDVTPGNPADITNVASAACIKQLLEYRLSKTIPAFPLVMGAIQEAQKTGSVCSYNYWDYVKVGDKLVKDQPCIDLRPIENIRLDGGASWIDPVNTSPYFCDIVPMYVCDVKQMMGATDDKTSSPKWKKFGDSDILKARPDVLDSIWKARQSGNPEKIEATELKNFELVWVMRWFMKDSQGVDHCFYTLGTENILTEAKPVDDVYFHGKRPYTLGCSIIETFRALKTSMPSLIRPVQQEINDVTNQRLDNVKFVLNKRWLVARGRQTDVQSLVRNVPGGVTLTSDPNTDIRESNWPDVTSSAYVENDRLSGELDELAGNFSPNTRVANNAMNDTLGGSRMASQGAGIMSDYLLRTVIETWWEPTLRHLVLLEQYYETDEVVLEVCERKAQLFPRFGISRITDNMLLNEVNVSVNVGMGASNPTERFQRFVMATKTATEMIATAPPSFNVQEAIKELYSNAGYRDGSRFWNEKIDPRLAKAMQAIQQLQGMVKGKQMELQFQGALEQARMQLDERKQLRQLSVDDKRITMTAQNDAVRNQIEDAKRVDSANLKLREIDKPDPVKMPEPVDPEMRQAELGDKLAAIDLKTAQAEKARKEAEAVIQNAAMTAADSEVNRQKVVAEAQAAMVPVVEHNSVAEQLRNVSEALSGLGAMGQQIAALQNGLGAVIGAMSAPRRKPSGMKMVKDGKVTKAVVVSYDDGTTEELSVN